MVKDNDQELLRLHGVETVVIGPNPDYNKGLVDYVSENKFSLFKNNNFVEIYHY